MKVNKLFVISAAACISFNAMAMTKLDIESNVKTKSASTLTMVKPDFGFYKVEQSLRLVPASVAASEHVIAQKGEMSIINASAASDVVTKGSIVRNTLTNNFSTLSGNITVLLNGEASATEIGEALGLKVVSVFPGTQVAVLAVNDGQDILAASEQLKSSGYTKEARIEVLETIYTAQ